ncbi:MAG: hypothetical protein ACC707_02230, partial [Thiohalomonadales bacterium]
MMENNIKTQVSLGKRSASIKMPCHSPFEPTQEEPYQAWRAHKLAGATIASAANRVDIKDPIRLTESERSALLRQCRYSNMALYSCQGADFDKHSLTQLCLQLGLK